jgi:putative hemolysin
MTAMPLQPPQPDPSSSLAATNGAELARAVVDGHTTAYPHLRRTLSSYLRDVGDFIELSQPDAARCALEMAISIKAEIDCGEEGVG